MAAIPGFSANDISNWYGAGHLTSQPQSGTSGSGVFSQLATAPPVGQAIPYQFQDINEPVGTPETSNYRPAVAKGEVIPDQYASRYLPTEYTIGTDGVKRAKAAIAKAGTAAIPVFTSLAAKQAYALAGRAEQEGAAGRLANLNLGNDILAGYDQSIANNRALSDQYQTQFDAGQTTATNALQSGYGQAQAGLLDRYNRNMGMVNQYGDSQRSDLAQQYAKQLAASNQSAIRRGLGNTTIRDSLNRGVNSDYARNNLALEDSLLQDRLRTDQSLSGDYLNSLIGGATATSGLQERQNQYRTNLWDSNLARENQGSAQRLGFLSGITNDYPTSADYGSYLLQSGVLQETAGSRS